MLNNMRTIAHGKAATRDTPAQAAQGLEVVMKALSTCVSLPELKAALSGMKSAKHAATGTAKTAPKATAKAAPTKPVKAADMVIPSQRAEAIKAAVRMLEYVSTHFLTLSDNRKEIQQVQNTIAMLQKAA